MRKIIAVISLILLFNFLSIKSAFASTTNPVWNMDGFWWLDDDASGLNVEDNTGFGAGNTAQETHITSVPFSTKFRLRTDISETANQNQGININPRLEYSVGDNLCNAAVTWTTVTTTTTDAFYLSDSTTITDGDAIGSNRITGDTKVWEAGGKLIDQTSPAGAELLDNKSREWEWSIQSGSGAAAGQIYTFRATNNGTALNAYSLPTTNDCPNATMTSITVSGTVLSSAGGTETVCDANGGTNELSLRVGSTTYNASCTDSTGAFSFTGVTPPSAGAGMVVWINDLGTDGATAIRYDGSGDSTNNSLYESTVSVTSDDTNPVDIIDMNTFDTVDDGDIPYTATDATPDTLSVTSGFNLRVNLKSGVANGSNVFTPNGTVTLASPGAGNLHIDDNAQATLDTATNSINGDILVDDGAIININTNTTVTGGDITVTSGGDVASSAGTVTMGASGTIGGGSTGSVFQLTNLTVSTGTTTLGADADNELDFTGDISVSTGATLAMNGKTADVDGGNFSTVGTGTVTCSSCTSGGLTLSGVGTTNGIGGGGTVTVYELILDGATNTTNAGSGVTALNSVTVGTGRTLGMGVFGLIVGNTDVANSGSINISGIFSQSSGTTSVRSSNGGSATIGGTGCTSTNCTFGGLNINPGVASAPTFTLGSAASQVITITGALTVGNGTNPVNVTANTNNPTINVTGAMSVGANGGNFVSASSSTLTVGGTVTNSGTFSGTGALDFNGNFSNSGSGAFTAPASASFTIAGNFTNGASATFTHNSGTVVMDATAGSPKTITSAGDAFNDLSIDNGGTAITWNLADALDVNDDLLIDTSNTLSTSTHAVNVAGNWTNNGTYTASNTTTLDGAGGTTQVVTGSTTFSTLSITNSATRVIQVANGSTQTISTNITLGGSTSCNALLVFRSSVLGSAFTVANSDATPTVSYVDFQDTTVTTNTFSSGTGITDSGGNTGVTPDNTCEGGSNSAEASNYSFQRKTFKDSTNNVHWLFFHDGDQIEYKYSSNNGTTWTRGGSLAYDTNDFSVWQAAISGTEYIWLAVTSGNDIVLRRGTLGVSSITWDAASPVVTVFDGTTYTHPYISLDSSNYIWIGARYNVGANYNFVAIKSANTADTTWTEAAFTFGSVSQLNDDQTNTNVYGNIVPLATGDMYATFVTGTNLEGCRYDDVTDNRWEDSSGSVCSVVAGTPESEGSSTRGTGGVKINDTDNPGSLTGSDSYIVQTSAGKLYTVINDGGSCEVWKSTDGSSWAESDSTDNPSCYYSTESNKSAISVVIDSQDMIHIGYFTADGVDTVYKYIQFDAAGDTDQFGTAVTIESESDTTIISTVAVTVDSNDMPHYVYQGADDGVGSTFVRYNNKIGGSWNASPVTVETLAAGLTSEVLDAVINEDNIPEISYINSTDGKLRAAVGNQNDSTSFTLQDIDITVSVTADQRGASIGIDADGNTWISYIDDTTNYIALAKHADTAAWTSWTIVDGDATLDNNNVGYEPSLSVIGKTIFVFYQDNNTCIGNCISYDVYDSGTSDWLGEKQLTSTGDSAAYQDAKVRYSKYNFHEPWLLDVLYSDGTDIYWSYVDLRAAKIDDASDFGAMTLGSRQVIRKKDGSLYAVVNDGADLEVWMSSDGYTWEEQDAANSPATTSGSALSATVDNNDNLHIVYLNNSSPTDVYYVLFTDSTKLYGTPELVHDLTTGTDSISTIAASVDASDVVHTAFSILRITADSGIVRYENRVGNDWAGGGSVYTSTDSSSVDITINDSNIPEISIIDSTNNYLSAAIGNVNDAASWTTHTVDSAVNDTGTVRGTSISVNTLTGDSWVAYVDDTNNYIALAKHTGATWTSNWSTITTKTDVGFEPSIAIAGSSDVYVFYENGTDDISYDIYDSDAASPAWDAETVLQTGTFQDIKTKWSFEWNNFGANRIDYLFSDGTDVYWDYLYVRRSPTNVDNASDFGAMPAAGRQVVRTSTGVLYSLVNDGGNCEVWRSADNGNSWAIQDSANDPLCGSAAPFVGALDSTGYIQLIYQDESAATDLNYITFNTSTNQFSAEDTINAGFTLTSAKYDLAVDSADTLHVVVAATVGNPGVQYASFDGAWNTKVTLEQVSGVNFASISIAINEDNIPEVAYINETDNHITAAVGNQNLATSFTLLDVETTATTTDANNGTSIGVDSAGNTWIVYVDEDGTDDYVTLAKHTDGATWADDANWTIDSETASLSSGKVGLEPSMAINGTDIYVFYEDDQDDIVFDKYDGSSWSGETLLEEHGALQDTKVRWSFLNNASYTTYGFDYLYSDGVDVFYNRMPLGTVPGTQDSIDTTVSSGLTKTISAVADSTNYDVHLIYIDSDGSLAYKRWDNGTVTWQTAVALDATTTDTYPSLSINSTNRNLYAYYTDSSNGAIYYKLCTMDASECASADWGSETSWQTGTNLSVSSNYAESNETFAQWAVGSTHVAIDWARITEAVATTFTLSNYRWFVDNDALDIGTDAWSAASGIDLAENTELPTLPVAYDPLNSEQEIRLRVGFTVNGSNLTASAKQFKLQFKEATDTSCTAGAWTDLGASEAWTYATSGVSDGATIITTRLAGSDVGGQYAKSAPTTANANTATTTQDIEYDFHIIAGSAFSGAKRYLFRVVESGGTVFDDYTNCPALSTEPGVDNLMRHGEFYTNYGEQGFWWAD